MEILKEVKKEWHITLGLCIAEKSYFSHFTVIKVPLRRDFNFKILFRKLEILTMTIHKAKCFGLDTVTGRNSSQ